MCIVAIAWQLFDNLPVVLLSNRDEFFHRPTTPAQQWADMPIFAGRDQQSSGTWLGYHQLAQGNQQGQQQEQLQRQQNGRWATVLNFRDGNSATTGQPSRGELVTHFLTSTLSPIAFARKLNLQAYAGFNLIIGDDKQAVVVNNRGYPPTPLYTGLHIFSNGQPECHWFKCERLRGRVRQEVLPLIAENKHIDYWKNASFDVLSDTLQAPSEQLPQTGVTPEVEQALSAICINTPALPNYGTRTQSILYMQQSADNIQLELISKELSC